MNIKNMLDIEIKVWYVLPYIRTQIVKKWKKEEMQQKDIAKLLGITPAAVSQYASGKRGRNIKCLEKPVSLLLKNIESSDHKNTISHKMMKYVNNLDCNDINKIREEFRK